MWESRVLRRAFERLELHEGKLSRAVLRGGGGGNVTSLPDTWVGNHPGLPGPMPQTPMPQTPMPQKILNRSDPDAPDPDAPNRSDPDAPDPDPDAPDPDAPDPDAPGSSIVLPSPH